MNKINLERKNYLKFINLIKREMVDTLKNITRNDVVPVDMLENMTIDLDIDGLDNETQFLLSNLDDETMKEDHEAISYFIFLYLELKEAYRG